MKYAKCKHDNNNFFRSKFDTKLPACITRLLHYAIGPLEHDKTSALKQNKGNFDAQMTLSASAKAELSWWIENIANEQNYISHDPPTLQITTDASLSGWGAECQAISTGGQWTFVEAKQHINYLELFAAFLGLQTFAKNKRHIHIRLRLDNTTGVSILNHMGTSHSPECNKLCKDIWEWCIKRHIWISAAYLPGALNTIADKESRCKNNNLEWMIDPQVLKHALTKLAFTPKISGVTRALIGGGGCIFIYSCSARRVSFEMNLVSSSYASARNRFICFPGK